MNTGLRFNLLIVIVFSTILIGCLIWGNTWQAFYYPNGCLVCEEDYIFSPIFKSKEECFDWAEDVKARRGNENDLYECGKNCKKSEKYGGLYICEETVD